MASIERVAAAWGAGVHSDHEAGDTFGQASMDGPLLCRLYRDLPRSAEQWRWTVSRFCCEAQTHLLFVCCASLYEHATMCFVTCEV